MNIEDIGELDRALLLKERIKECEWWPAVLASGAGSGLFLAGVWLLLEGKLVPGLPGFGPLPLRGFFLGLFDRLFVGGAVLLAVGIFGAMAKGLFQQRNRWGRRVGGGVRVR